MRLAGPRGGEFNTMKVPGISTFRSNRNGRKSQVRPRCPRSRHLAKTASKATPSPSAVAISAICPASLRTGDNN
jgi:hypothetical protein